MATKRFYTILAGVVAACAILAGILWVRQSGSSPVERAATYVGNTACASCHTAERNAWGGSQHDLAMQEAAETTVLGDFSEKTFTSRGVTSTFFRRDGRFMVRTDGADGRLADFEIKFTFGVAPLQQYLIELPGGRLQAFGIAWDSRPKSVGGQRWFHLYPDQQIRAGDPLHWTGIQQNWNYMCADCHSTNVRKNYDATSHTFKTAWSEIDVGCEACHGPGSNHVAWARDEGRENRSVPNRGLVAALDERKDVIWSIDPASGNAVRSSERTSEREIEVCARCHSRRGQLTDTVHAGDPLHDGFRVTLLEPGLFHADGQQLGEVYNYAPFLQSRMYAKGVTCGDCHDPHTQKLRAPGNGVCILCHSAQKFDTPSHHGHTQGSAGATCAACHMPTTTYMVVDPRHDHSLRVPRPDLTVTLGTPNACNACHTRQSAQWAADVIVARSGRPAQGLQNYADAFTLAERGAPGSTTALARVIEDPSQPAIARATALRLLASNTQPFVDETLAAGLNNVNPLLREAAVAGLSTRSLDTRLRHLPGMLTDPMRAVRVSAASALGDATESQLPEERRTAFHQALEEYEATLRYDADRPEAQTSLGDLRMRQRQPQAAIDSYREAIRLDATFVPAYVNLADVQRARGNEMEAETLLRSGLKANPSSGVLHYALGLSLVRQSRHSEATVELAQAAQLEPDSTRYTYVYGVALHDTGQIAQSMRVLEAGLARHPFDRDILFVLALYSAQRQQIDSSREYVQRLLEIAPGDPEAQALSARLGTAASQQ